jgi:hypothetical protein
MAEKYPKLEMEAVLYCAKIHLDKPSLRALACTLALRFDTFSLSKAVCVGTSSTKHC